MERNNNIQSTPTECIDRQTFIDYASGTLSAAEMYRVERHTAECPMCADELEGIMLLDNPTSIVEIESELNSKIDKRVEKGRVVSFGYAIRVAASFLVLLSISFLTYNYFSSLNSTYTLAENLYRKESVWTGKQLVDEKPFSGSTVSVSTSGHGVPVGNNHIQSKQIAYAVAEENPESNINQEEVIDLAADKEDLDEVIIAESKTESTLTIENDSNPVAVVTSQASPAMGMATNTSSKRLRNEKASEVLKEEVKYKKAEPVQQVADDMLGFAAESVASEREIDNEIYLIVQEMPQFKAEGFATFEEYINKKLKYSKRDVKANDECVYVEFIVETDGKVSNAKVVRAVNPDFDAEALRVIMSSPKWQPGIQRGMPVRVALTFPVKFLKN